MKRCLCIIKAISLGMLPCLSGLAHGDDSIKEIVDGLKSDSLDIRKESRKKLSRYAASGKGGAVNEMLSLYIANGSPEVRFALKRALMEQLYGKGFLGIRHTGSVVNYDGKQYICRRIQQVNSGGPAADAGLKIGDVIFNVGGAKPIQKDVKKAAHLQYDDAAAILSNSIKASKPGTKLKITVLRGEKMVHFEPVLASYQAYIKGGKNVFSFLKGGERLDKYGFSQEENDQFVTLLKKFRAGEK